MLKLLRNIANMFVHKFACVYVNIHLSQVHDRLNHTLLCKHRKCTFTHHHFYGHFSPSEHRRRHHTFVCRAAAALRLVSAAAAACLSKNTRNINLDVEQHRSALRCCVLMCATRTRSNITFYTLLYLCAHDALRGHASTAFCF